MCIINPYYLAPNVVSGAGIKQGLEFLRLSWPFLVWLALAIYGAVILVRLFLKRSEGRRKELGIRLVIVGAVLLMVSFLLLGTMGMSCDFARDYISADELVDSLGEPGTYLDHVFFHPGTSVDFSDSPYTPVCYDEVCESSFDIHDRTLEFVGDERQGIFIATCVNDSKVYLTDGKTGYHTGPDNGPNATIMPTGCHNIPLERQEQETREAEDKREAEFARRRADGEAATVAVVSPHPGQTLRGPTDVIAYAHDNWEVEMVYFNTRRDAVTEYGNSYYDRDHIGKTDSTPYIMHWDTRDVEDGERVISISASEPANYRAEDRITVYIDNEGSFDGYRADARDEQRDDMTLTMNIDGVRGPVETGMTHNSTVTLKLNNMGSEAQYLWRTDFENSFDKQQAAQWTDAQMIWETEGTTYTASDVWWHSFSTISYSERNTFIGTTSLNGQEAFIGLVLNGKTGSDRTYWCDASHRRGFLIIKSDPLTVIDGEITSVTMHGSAPWSC